ncbi:MAG: type I methionyl aminopeptidase [Clostridia bacterium]|nr:type I methionyl aminopeptidase [Clostridia bacterium]
MIKIKTEKEIELLRIAGEITRNTLLEVEKYVKPGVTTKQLDKIAYEYITKQNAKPSFLHYGGFPATICASVNEVVVHGFPNDTPLEEGDIVSIDVGACFKGYHGDSARTFPVGKISTEKQKLIDVTKQSFFEGIKNIKAGKTVGDISSQVQNYAEKFGFGVVRDMVGHGVGRELHEEPEIPNFGYAGLGPKLRANMVIAIEPMVNMGTYEVTIKGWSCKTSDGKPSAHFENTILITDSGVEILT